MIKWTARQWLGWMLMWFGAGIAVGGVIAHYFPTFKFWK